MESLAWMTSAMLLYEIQYDKSTIRLYLLGAVLYLVKFILVK